MGHFVCDESRVSRSWVGWTWDLLFTVDTTYGRLGSTLWTIPFKEKKHTQCGQRERPGWDRPWNHDYYGEQRWFGPISILPVLECAPWFSLGDSPHLTGHVIYVRPTPGGGFMTQAWPFRDVHLSGHRDWFRGGHVTQAQPKTVLPMTFSGIIGKEEVLFCRIWWAGGI